MSDNTGQPAQQILAQATVTSWLKDLVNADRSPHTVRSYSQALQQFLMWYVDEEQQPLAISDLTPITLIGYRNYLQHDRIRAANTINIHVAALRAWCIWLVEQHLISINPAARLRSVGRQTPSQPKCLSDRQINALLREAQRTHNPWRDYAIIQLLLQTGMRIGECAALNYGDITFRERSGIVRVRAGKGNKTRIVPLNISARKALADYVAPVLGAEPTIESVVAVWPRDNGFKHPQPLWVSRRSTRLSVQAMRRMIDDVVNICALRHLVPAETSAHTLRHSFAMNYLSENPGDLIGLATLLGHSSLDTTRIYGQPTADQLASRVERLKLNAYL
ncbi:MAG: tyrosine-type recombinase/integrase [Nitrososphaera sp.]